MAQYRKKHSVQSNGSFNYIRNIISVRFACFGIYFSIEILHFLFTVLLVILQIKISTTMNTFQLLKTDRKIKFNITCSVGIMGQLNVIMKAVILLSKTKGQMPFHPFFFPVFIPLLLCARLNKKLHFHLLKLPHAKNELPRNDLIPECLTNLCNTKRNL